jgi:hypothetical protein
MQDTGWWLAAQAAAAAAQEDGMHCCSSAGMYLGTRTATVQVLLPLTRRLATPDDVAQGCSIMCADVVSLQHLLSSDMLCFGKQRTEALRHRPEHASDRAHVRSNHTVMRVGCVPAYGTSFEHAKVSHSHCERIRQSAQHCGGRNRPLCQGACVVGSF